MSDNPRVNVVRDAINRSVGVTDMEAVAAQILEDLDRHDLAAARMTTPRDTDHVEVFIQLRLPDAVQPSRDKQVQSARLKIPVRDVNEAAAANAAPILQDAIESIARDLFLSPHQRGRLRAREAEHLLDMGPIGVNRHQWVDKMLAAAGNVAINFNEDAGDAPFFVSVYRPDGRVRTPAELKAAAEEVSR